MSAVLDPTWRCVGDPLADALVGELGPGTMGYLDHAASNDAPASGPPSLQDFIEQTCRRPRDVRWDAVSRASSWCERNLAYLSFGLLCASLPTLFLSGEGATVLRSSGRLLDQIDARINRTARYMLAVVAPGGLEGSGRALRASCEVRLLHACVRKSLTLEPRATVPICQQDLVATLFAFGVTPIAAARRLGLSVSAEEADDYYQLWLAVAPALGVNLELVPRRFADADAMFDRLVERATTVSDAGRALAAALVEGISRHLGIEPNSEIAAWIVRYLIGPRRASVLGIPEVSAEARLRYTQWSGGRALQALAPLMGRRIHSALVDHKLRRQKSATTSRL